ncbi:hypothetical protein A2U01_0078426 [Trifolium medium]|uniref:Uncharacterized protein n=1 Tax=Trifolium medium TaxID=97028 RepID=A0A392TB09_9FABA|nr:hypothetical protein [Trifolium medium]
MRLKNSLAPFTIDKASTPSELLTKTLSAPMGMRTRSPKPASDILFCTTGIASPLTTVATRPF